MVISIIGPIIENKYVFSQNFYEYLSILKKKKKPPHYNGKSAYIIKWLFTIIF